ncbi:helix-turn-helix domain-containing protein [Actinophytocola gossypii]|uniref:Helix-turn-helix domain-containing protein n=1 Tax=Actinophytocola gossypii TaxID=2812003 RepID=A0ABT2JBQ0_9PSEU|nr:helix-turn-helix transcriptional regulator [Actinophytocola gossypii]MCT2585293.1 helix-turn-helix domain-containing protein [Actinophytocola gossypii]
MHDREPTVRSRELGDGLRRAMEGGGYHASGVARELGWSPSRVSRILSGKRGGSSHDVAAFIAVCGVRGDERERLMGLSFDHGPGWRVRHHPGLPRRSRTTLEHEERASAIGGYSGAVVPELLQTDAYAAAVLAGGANVPEWDAGARVEAVAERQRVLDRDDPPRCVFYLHEFVLHTPVGGSSVMSEQLHVLLRRSVRPNLTVRVVPRTAGAHPGMAGTFTLLDVLDFKRVVHLEGETASDFLETSAEVLAYQRVLDALARVALDDVRSRELIATLATRLYGAADTLPR